ncbi:aldehyde ferredoxin oxidoreductase family protein [Chloroflexota bacterium]
MYGGTILRVNLSENKISREPTTSYSGVFLGGRGINVKILYDNGSPQSDPLDPANPLIFGTGPLCGTPVPASRVEVTAKSPETGYLGSSNFGGNFGPELKFAGYDHIVITGKADKPIYLWIYNDQVEIKDASHLWGKDTYQTQAIIRSEADTEVKTACIGSAGENLVRFATIQHELKHGTGRTGMGAIMGSKNLKAVAVRGTKGISLSNPEKYLDLATELQQAMRRHPGVIEKQKHGHAYEQDWWRISNARGQTPQPAFSCDLFFKYQNEIKRTGCFGCPTQCMDLYPIAAGGGGALSCSLYTSPFYWVRNTDVELLLECSLRAIRHGIDTTTSMAIISWLMELYENGVITAKDTDSTPMKWGSREAILGMLEKIINREGIGDILADGILPAAKGIGRNSVDYANHVKGLPLYTANAPSDIIPDKGLALSLVVSSRGDSMKVHSSILGEKGMAEKVALMQAKLTGDEKKGIEGIATARQRVKEIASSEKSALADEYEGKPELTIFSEDVVTITDCLSVCKLCSSFISFPFNEDYQAGLFSTGTGILTSVDTLFEFAKRINNLERVYNVREGMTRETDSLPKRFMDHPMRRGDSVSVLDAKKFEQMKDKYYALRGWDIASGIPTQEILEQTGLKYIAPDLEKLGKLQGKVAAGPNKTEKR